MNSEIPTIIPSISDAQPAPSSSPTSSTSSADSSATASEDDSSSRPRPHRLTSRPKIGSRQQSGSMIVENSTSNAMVDEEIDDGDVRSMSPRRSSDEVDKLGEEARQDMIEQAKTLQASLQAIVDRVESVKSEHEKLEGGNKFLQSYIGELMQTSKITSQGPGNKKGKGRSTK